MELPRITRKLELAEGEFITFEAAKMLERPDQKVVFRWLDGCPHTAIILFSGSPSYENLFPIKERMRLDMNMSEVDFIVVTGHVLSCVIARWYMIGNYVDRVGQWLTISSLAMSCLKYPRAALGLAVGGCAFWGVHNRWWNTVYANYELEPCSFKENLHRLLKDKAVLKKKKPRERRKIFNMSTALTACATALAAGVFFWARHKF